MITATFDVDHLATEAGHKMNLSARATRLLGLIVEALTSEMKGMDEAAEQDVETFVTHDKFVEVFDNFYRHYVSHFADGVEAQGIPATAILYLLTRKDVIASVLAHAPNSLRTSMGCIFDQERDETP